MFRVMATWALAAGALGCTGLAGLDGLSFGDGGASTSKAATGGAGGVGGEGQGGAGPGVGGGGSGPGGGGCGNIVVADDFSDGAPNAGLFDASYGTGAVEEITGVMHATAQNGDGATYATTEDHDMRGACATLRLVDLAPSTLDSGVELRLRRSNDDNVSVRVAGADIQCAEFAGGMFYGLEFATYDEVAHNWLRICGETGVLHGETSPDGIAWERICTATMVSPNALTVNFGATSGTDAADIRVDDFSLCRD